MLGCKLYNLNQTLINSINSKWIYVFLITIVVLIIDDMGFLGLTCFNLSTVIMLLNYTPNMALRYYMGIGIIDFNIFLKRVYVLHMYISSLFDSMKSPSTLDNNSLTTTRRSSWWASRRSGWSSIRGSVRHIRWTR